MANIYYKKIKVKEVIEMDNQQNQMNINWYPGHMAKTKREIIQDLKLIDVVIELVDSRIPISSRNPDIKNMTKGKKKVIVFNKSDLADQKETRLLHCRLLPLHINGDGRIRLKNGLGQRLRQCFLHTRSSPNGTSTVSRCVG